MIVRAQICLVDMTGDPTQGGCFLLNEISCVIRSTQGRHSVENDQTILPQALLSDFIGADGCLSVALLLCSRGHYCNITPTLSTTHHVAIDDVILVILVILVIGDSRFIQTETLRGNS